MNGNESKMHNNTVHLLQSVLWKCDLSPGQFHSKSLIKGAFPIVVSIRSMISLLSCPNPGAQARFFQVSLSMPIHDEVGPRFLALSGSKGSSRINLVLNENQ